MPTTFLSHWLPLLEAEMQTQLSNNEAAVARHYGMMHYHMGWVDAGFAPDRLPAGKRLRPMLLLMACAEAGGDPRQALPAAAAIEILHNFSLVHDDIEDGDESRRHRPTVWKLWGVPQAINAGDGMFALAFSAIQRLAERGVTAEGTLRALRIFTDTCVELTEGQHLDMLFEQRDQVSVDEYLRMIQGKTAALVGASVAIGALVGGAPAAQDQAMRRFGQGLGLSFQIQDDILGIWGESTKTGKPKGNDLLRRKKSMPILHGLANPAVGAQLAALMARPDFGPGQLPAALALLEEAGSRHYSSAQMIHWHEAARTSLCEALGDRAEASALWALMESLLERES